MVITHESLLYLINIMCVHGSISNNMVATSEIISNKANYHLQNGYIEALQVRYNLYFSTWVTKKITRV